MQPTFSFLLYESTALTDSVWNSFNIEIIEKWELNPSERKAHFTKLCSYKSKGGKMKEIEETLVHRHCFKLDKALLE